MIASDDVRRVTFDRAMRGYRCEDVDDYLKQVADSIDSLAAENDDLQKKLVILAQRIDQYRADEDTLSTTMINAQRLGENVIKEAKQKAAEIIRAANIKAEDREQRARDEVELAQQELVTIKQEADAFKKRLMDLYRQHIEMIAKIPEYHPNRAEQQAAQPQPEPAPAPAPVQSLDEEKIDTVEFAFAPKTKPILPDDDMPSVAGLYGGDMPEKPAKKSGSRSRGASARSTGKNARKTKNSAKAELDAFDDIDYDV